MKVVVSDHAVTRYHERVRPTILRDRAKAELEALVAQATEIIPDVPWAEKEHRPEQEYLVISDGVLAALDVMDDGSGNVVLTTVLTRGEISPERRARRREHRRKKAFARKIGRANGVNRDQNWYRQRLGKDYAE